MNFQFSHSIYCLEQSPNPLEFHPNCEKAPTKINAKNLEKVKPLHALLKKSAILLLSMIKFQDPEIP